LEEINPKPKISISVDIANYDESQRQGLQLGLEPYFDVDVTPFEQRTPIPPATVIISFFLVELSAIATPILVNVLSEQINRWLSKPKPQEDPQIEFDIKIDDNLPISAYVKTTSETVAIRVIEAIEAFRRDARPDLSGKELIYDETSKRFNVHDYD
jgi:hypothetical protein